jgi:UDP-N-acetylglucosamine pyrophosphorylase
MLPAMDEHGKIMMGSNHTLKMAPNGSGALFDSLKSDENVQRAISSFEYV